MFSIENRRTYLLSFVCSLYLFGFVILFLNSMSLITESYGISLNDIVSLSDHETSIDAPVSGAIVFANIISVNAPIEGDLFAAGGQVTINTDVSGKIVASGNMIDLGGKSTNAILAANDIHFDPNSVIIKDAYAAGGTVNNEGDISGQLVAMTDNFQNNGTIGDLEIVSQDSMIPDIEGLLSLFGTLIVIGVGILGIILVKLLPNQFNAVRLVIRKSIIKNTVVGFLLIVLFVVVIVLSVITVVGLPVAAFGLLVLLLGLTLSSLMVSFALGKKILELLGRKSSSDINNISSFLIGFVILNLLYIVPIPYFGQIVQVIVTSFGFGAIYYTIRKSRSFVSTELT